MKTHQVQEKRVEQLNGKDVTVNFVSVKYTDEVAPWIDGKILKETMLKIRPKRRPVFSSAFLGSKKGTYFATTRRFESTAFVRNEKRSMLTYAMARTRLSTMTVESHGR
jgi:hypothetical protein